MRTPAGSECPFYYEDYFRGRETRECRLLARNPQIENWKPNICRVCPVPAILRTNACPHMALEARIVRRFHFWRRIEVEAYCTKHFVRVSRPTIGCGHCHEEGIRTNIFDLPVAPDT